MKFALSLAVLLLGAPAAAQTPGAYEQAVSARHGGKPARAVQLLEPLLRSDPNNADAWVQLGYAQLALGQPHAARRSFQRALAIAPSYIDAREGLALARERMTATPRFRADVEGAYTWVRQGRDNWREMAAQLRFEPRFGLALTGRAEAARRFGRRDLYLEGRLDLAHRDGAFAYLLGGGTLGADFRPEIQLGAGGGYKLVQRTNATVATLDLRYARYGSGAVWTVNPGVEQYVAGGKASLTARWINLIEDGRRSDGWFARVDLEAAKGLRLFGGGADAPDTSEGVVIDTFSLFGGAVIDLDDRRSLRLSLARDHPDEGARRTQLAIGVGARF